MGAISNSSGDKLDCTVTALTIGALNYSIALWVRLVADLNASGGLFAAAVDPTDPVQWLLCYLGSDGVTPGVGNSSTTLNSPDALSTGVGAYIVISRDTGLLRYRVFDDSTSTTPVTNVTAIDANIDSNYDHVVIGELFTGEFGSFECTSMKVHTGVAWTNAQCRAESQNYALQTAGGTDRYAWKLTDVDADTNGLNEIGGAGPNFANTGFVAGSWVPTQLAGAVAAYIPLDRAHTPAHQTLVAM